MCHLIKQKEKCAILSRYEERHAILSNCSKEGGDFISRQRKKWKVEVVPHNKVRKENTEN